MIFFPHLLKKQEDRKWNVFPETFWIWSYLILFKLDTNIKPLLDSVELSSSQMKTLTHCSVEISFKDWISFIRRQKGDSPSFLTLTTWLHEKLLLCLFLQPYVGAAAVRGWRSGCSFVLNGSNNDTGRGPSADEEDCPTGRAVFLILCCLWKEEWRATGSL